MEKYKYLLKNIGALTVGQFGTKVLVFFLVPLYTSILSTSEYGTYDIIHNTVGLLIPLFTLNISEATLRFSIDCRNRDDKQNVLSISLYFVFVSIIVVVFLIVINNMLGFFSVIKEYWGFLLLMYIVLSVSNVITYFVRGIGHLFDLSVSGIISSISIIGFNILFLVVLRMGLKGYFLAYILGPLVQLLYLECRLRLHKFMKFRNLNMSIKREMQIYSTPMIANSMGWWVNNVSDRFVVTWLCGLTVNGIYSVGYKIPSVMNMLQTIFSQAWTLSAVQQIEEKDRGHFFSQTYSVYNMFMVLSCSVLIGLTIPLARILYANDFYAAWEYVPMLLISTVFGALSGYIGGIFSAKKDSKEFAKSTIIGAAVNASLNVVLVFQFGAIGAAISTAFSYFMVWMLRLIHVKKHIELKINIKRDCLTYFVLVFQFLALILFRNNHSFCTFVEILLVLLVVSLEIPEIKIVYVKLSSDLMVRKRR